MNSKKFLTLITLISLFCNQFSLCMFNCCKKKTNEGEKTPLLEEIVIKDSKCKLPYEMLVEIFGYLGDKEKRNVRLASKEFNEIYGFCLKRLKTHEFKVKRSLFDKKNKDSKKKFDFMLSYIKKLGEDLVEQSTSDCEERELKISAKFIRSSYYDIVAKIGKKSKLSKKNTKEMVKKLHKLRYGPSLREKCIDPGISHCFGCCFWVVCLFFCFLFLLFLLVGGLILPFSVGTYFSPCNSPGVYEHTNSTMYEDCAKECQDWTYVFNVFCKHYNITRM
ncbi:F-box protein [Candidatus Dependentiae bacterium]